MPRGRGFLSRNGAWGVPGEIERDAFCAHGIRGSRSLGISQTPPLSAHIHGQRPQPHEKHYIKYKTDAQPSHRGFSRFQRVFSFAVHSCCRRRMSRSRVRSPTPVIGVSQLLINPWFTAPFFLKGPERDL